MAGLLLDSSPLLWMDEGTWLRAPALFAIAEAATNGTLFASEISIWELGVALQKKRVEKRPNLRGLPADLWFLDATRNLGVKSLQISSLVALEAGKVPAIYESGDPGDCFLIATARVHGLTLVTRDEPILKLAARNPEYLSVIPC